MHSSSSTVPGAAIDGDQPDHTDHLLRTHQSRGSEGVEAQLGGTYNFVGVAPESGSARFHDFSGLYPLYWHQGDDFAVFSNRSQSVARTIGSRRLERRRLGMGRRPRWEPRRRALPAVMCATCRRVTPPAPIGPPARSGSRRVSTWISAGDHRLTSGVTTCYPASGTTSPNALAALPEAPGASRACAWGSRAARIPGSAWPSRRPPASRIASRRIRAAVRAVPKSGSPAGSRPGDRVRGRRQVAPRGRGGAGSARGVRSGFRRRLQQNITRYEGVVGAWSARAEPDGSALREHQGLGWGALPPRQREGLPEAAKSEHRRAPGVVREDPPRDGPVGRHASGTRGATGWVARGLGRTERRARSSRTDLLPEKFYVDFRLGHWSGPNLQRLPACVSINPLAHQFAATKNLELSQRGTLPWSASISR